MKSIDKNIIENDLIHPANEEIILRKSWDEYRSGNMQSDSWKNVEKRLRKLSIERMPASNKN